MAERAEIGEDIFEAGQVIEATITTRISYRKTNRFRERYDIAVLKNGNIINMKEIVPNLSTVEKKVINVGGVEGLLRARNSSRRYLTSLILKKDDVLALVGAFRTDDNDVKYELIFGEGSIRTEDVKLAYSDKVFYARKAYYVEPSGKEYLLEKTVLKVMPLVKINVGCGSPKTIIAKGPILGILQMSEMKGAKHVENEDIWILPLSALKLILERAEIEIDCSLKSPS